MQPSNKDTIAAIATPPGSGGIGVIRISGPEGSAILSKVWRGNVGVTAFEPRKLYLGTMVDASGAPLDRVLAVHMPSPHTYTGEDVVEFSCHGSQVILRKLLDACVAAGARVASPGEFTRRAFLNGKIDLAQAEAVADLIEASSDQAARLAREQLEGRLSQEVQALHDQLSTLRAFVEATIDFSEEAIEMIEHERIREKLLFIHDAIAHLAATFEQGRLMQDGVRVAIIGRPNVGKSSLLNRFAGCDRAIVHDQPGTTRDVIEVSVDLDGMLFHISDTAGLRESADAVESIGIERSHMALKQADLVLLVLDGSQALEPYDFQLLEEVVSKRAIICVNKCDLSLHPSSLRKRGSHIQTGDSRVHGDDDLFLISATTGDGIEALFQACRTACTSQMREGTGVLVTKLRHKEALDKATKGINAGLDSISRNESAEFCAHHLREAQEALGRIIGIDVTEEVLDKIFSSFCIGK